MSCCQDSSWWYLRLFLQVHLMPWSSMLAQQKTLLKSSKSLTRIAFLLFHMQQVQVLRAMSVFVLNNVLFPNIVRQVSGSNGSVCIDLSQMKRVKEINGWLRHQKCPLVCSINKYNNTATYKHSRGCRYCMWSRCCLEWAQRHAPRKGNTSFLSGMSHIKSMLFIPYICL